MPDLNEEWVEAQSELLRAVQTAVTENQKVERSRDYVLGYIEGMVFAAKIPARTAATALTYFEAAWPHE